jgi:hypothetical protein
LAFHQSLKFLMDERTISAAFFILLFNKFVLLFLKKLSNFFYVWRTDGLLEYFERKIYWRSRPLHEIPSHEIDLLFSVVLNGLFANLLKPFRIGVGMMQIGELLMKVGFLEDDLPAIAEQILWGLLFHTLPFSGQLGKQPIFSAEKQRLPFLYAKPSSHHSYYSLPHE